MVAVAQGGVYLFAGDDELKKEEEIRRRKLSLLPKPSWEFDFDIFYAGAGKADDIISRARTHPAVAKHRLIVVKEAERAKEEDKRKLLEYCENPHDTTCLILLTSFEPKKDEFLNALKNKAEVKLFKIPYDERPPSRFDLADRLIERKAGRALEILSFLLKQNERPHEALGFIARQYKGILEAKYILKRGGGREELMANFRGHPYYLDKFIAQVKSLNLMRLKADIARLLKADLDIKTSRLNASVVLELLVVELCK